jgi:two-component system, chemotaxis family, response regulator WspF
MRIAIVNDTLLAVEGLRRVIAGLPGHSIAWVARDGMEAVEQCKRDTPDLILMDLLMPVMDGVEATRRIMATTPCAILVVTARIDGNSAKVFDALGAGALDATQTPVLHGSVHADGAGSLKFKIEMLQRRLTGDLPAVPVSPSAGIEPRTTQRTERLVAIGSSAGGPAALATILSSLPADFGAGIVVVQHIDEQFVPSLVSWLKEHCRLSVRIACAGDRPQAGAVLVAGTNDHLTFIKSSALGYTAEPRECSYRPSVDVFFESVLRIWRGEVVGVLLSGMGRDGALGLKKLRDSGAVTIAQDAATSSVYGMPKAAVELNAAAKVLPAHSIAGELVSLCAARKCSPWGK